MEKRIVDKLKKGPEQKLVVGPLVERLLKNGWLLEQMMFGKNEWRVPKNPSEASKREKGFTRFNVSSSKETSFTLISVQRELGDKSN